MGKQFLWLLPSLPASVSTAGTPGVRGFLTAPETLPPPRSGLLLSHSPIRLTHTPGPISPPLLQVGTCLSCPLLVLMHENPLPSSPEGSLKGSICTQGSPSPSPETPSQCIFTTNHSSCWTPSSSSWELQSWLLPLPPQEVNMEI